VRRLDFPLALLAGLATYWLYAPFTAVSVDPHHDGIMLKPAMDVFYGKTLFRDTFCQYGALTTYLHALALRAWGPRLVALRLFTQLCYALAAGVLVLGWRRLLPRSLTLVALALWLMQTHFFSPQPMLPWSSVPALLFQAVALLGLLVAHERGSPTAAGLAGAAAGLTFLARQPVGGATFAAVAASFTIGALRRDDRGANLRALAACVGGFALVLTAFFAHLLSSDALQAWYRQTVIAPRRWAMSAASGGRTPLLPYPTDGLMVFLVALAMILPLRLLDRGRRVGWLLLVAYPAFLVLVAPRVLGVGWVRGLTSAFGFGLATALIAAVVAWWRAPAGAVRQAAAALAAVLVSLAAWTQLYPLGDFAHAFWAVAPGVGVVVHAAWRATGRRTLLTALALAIHALPYVVHVSFMLGRARPPDLVTLVVPPVLAGMQVTAEQAPTWHYLDRTIGEYVTAHPGASLMVEGRDALYATLIPETSNPGPFYVIWPDFELQGIVERVLMVARQQPLVLRQGDGRPLVNRALAKSGYRPILAVPPNSVLMAAPERPPPEPQP
jgi:hypothetical protein